MESDEGTEPLSKKESEFADDSHEANDNESEEKTVPMKTENNS